MKRRIKNSVKQYVRTSASALAIMTPFALSGFVSTSVSAAESRSPIVCPGDACNNDEEIVVTGTGKQVGMLHNVIGNGQSISVKNGESGVLNITSENHVAFGQHVAVGSFTKRYNDATVGIENSGTIYSNSVRTSSEMLAPSAGMMVDVYGNNNSVRQLNSGKIFVTGKSANINNTDNFLIVGMDSNLQGGFDDSNVMDVVNSGDIGVRNSSKNGYSYGMHVLSGTALDATMNNAGRIIVETLGSVKHPSSGEELNRGTAVGMNLYLNGGDDSTVSLSNSGAITANSFWLAGGMYAEVDGLAVDVKALDSRFSLNNTGIITAAAGVADGNGEYTAFGMKIGAVQDRTGQFSADIKNSGKIDVTAYGAQGRAYGIHAKLSESSRLDNDNNPTRNEVDIWNYGEVNVTGATAHQLYVSGKSGTANLKYWNLALQDRTSGNQSLFAVADGATLNFSDTHMVLRPGLMENGYQDNKKFNVKDMVYKYTDTAAVTGQIGGVSTPVAFLTAKYGLVDINGTNTWDNQWVSLNVDAENSDGNTAGGGVVDNMQSQVDRVGNLLVGGNGGGGGIAFGDGALRSVQTRVYYGYQERRGTGAAITDSVGTVTFGDFDVGDGHTLGFHAGIEYANLRSKSNTLKIQSLSAILGGQGRYNFSDSLYLRGQLSGILSHNRNEFSTFTGDSARNNTINTGLYGAVYAGYDYKIDEENTITPEGGLSGLWSHIPSIDVKYDRSPDLNQSYKTQNYTALYANAGVRWTGAVDIAGVQIRPTLMGGVRQTLTDGKIRSSMVFSGNQYNTSITRDRTMGIVDVGANTTFLDGVDGGLNYRGEYGANTTNHIGYLNVTVRF